jgi:hypothetical protein
MIPVNLRAEAATEARRLSRARAWLRDGDLRALQLLEADGGWIARPRRARVGRLLGGRMCLIWRVSFADASGRLVESRLVPLLVETATGLGRMLCDATSNALFRTRVETDSDAWRLQATRVVDLFTTTRLSREREIAERSSTAEPPTQGGLFDRRADRERQARAAALVESQQAMFDRRRSVEGAGAIALRPAQLLLAIVP